MKTQNPWDALSEKFNGDKKITKIDPDAADNILIAWPPIINQINKHFNRSKHISIFDYGCGTGSFCEKLRTLGYKKVVGMDSSRAMIAAATKQYGTHIPFIHSSAKNKIPSKPVDVLTGIMVFQFIDDISRTFKNLVDILKPGGLFIFAVHNPTRVTTLLKNHSPLFSHFQSTEHSNQGIIHLGKTSVPIYIRTPTEYDKIIGNLGLSKICEEYPPFTDDFMA